MPTPRCRKPRGTHHRTMKQRHPSFWGVLPFFLVRSLVRVDKKTQGMQLGGQNIRPQKRYCGAIHRQNRRLCFFFYTCLFISERVSSKRKELSWVGYVRIICDRKHYCPVLAVMQGFHLILANTHFYVQLLKCEGQYDFSTISNAFMVS